MKNKINLKSAQKVLAFCALILVVSAFSFAPRQAFAKVETNEKEGLYLLSAFSTSFSLSSENRAKNVALAAKSVNNVVLMPSDEFSFNRIVGERSKERGYAKAAVIEKGRFVEGFGGGVCQVSTAVYVAAIKAGLFITELHPHSVPSSYVSPSMDSTVGYDYFDLRFVNDTGGVIVIKTEVKDRILTVKIFGEKKPLYNVVLKSNVIERIIPESDEVLEKAPDKITPAFDENGVFVLTPMRVGIKSELYAYYYQNGALAFSKRLRYDYYREQKRVIIKAPEIAEE